MADGRPADPSGFVADAAFASSESPPLSGGRKEEAEPAKRLLCESRASESRFGYHVREVVTVE
ncbi:hypothetical protein [Haloprofundus halobius]|uniref:hypothetical protein n=1 Tax=Haloprofundus halobius TaxID=2876194 RepID=UPI001CCD0D31|nr:hypothetical protein [Haloprofundus halobius]